MPLNIEQAYLTIRRGNLYKYKSLMEQSFEHVREILIENKIFFARPSQLNDPAECKPLLTIGDINDPMYRPEVDAWVRRCVAHRDPQPTEEEIQFELAQLTQQNLEALLIEATQVYQREVDNHYFIFSMSDSVNNQYLWNTYADNYEGVCLRFFVNPFFGTAFKVRYTDEIPALDITNDEAMDSLVMTTLVKRSQWLNEGEYRLILSDPPLEDDPPLVDQRYEFPPEQLTAVIMGHNIARQHKEELLIMINNRDPLPQCLIASPDPKTNNVRIQDFLC